MIGTVMGGNPRIKDYGVRSKGEGIKPIQSQESGVEKQ